MLQCGAAVYTGQSDTDRRGLPPRTAPILVVRYVLLECPHEAESRLDLKKAQGGQLEYNSLLCTLKGVGIESKWVIQSGRIRQFHLAGPLLYRGEEGKGE